MQKTLILALLLVLLAAPGNALAMTWLLSPFAFADQVAMLIWEPFYAKISMLLGPMLCPTLINFIALALSQSVPSDTSYCETAIAEYAAYSFFPGPTRQDDDYNYSWNTNYVRKW